MAFTFFSTDLRGKRFLRKFRESAGGTKVFQSRRPSPGVLIVPDYGIGLFLFPVKGATHAVESAIPDRRMRPGDAAGPLAAPRGALRRLGPARAAAARARREGPHPLAQGLAEAEG